MRWRRIASWLLTAGLLLALWKYQAIIDWWTLRNYQPPTEIVALADTAKLSDTGRRDFYLSTPEINTKPDFARNCPVLEKRQSLVLGCYQANNTYILRVDDDRLKGVMPVTAAHEMLHAAYDRLSNSERDKVNNLLKQFYPKIKDPDFKDLIKDYQESEPGQLENELHSLVATEIKDIPTELEEYYSKYFSDRKAVVKQFSQYQAVFETIEERRLDLVAEANNLKSQIDNLDGQISAAANRANQLSDQIQRLRSQGRTAESNELVPAQNQAANEANALVDQGQTLVSRYNQLVQEINDLALVAQDLYDKLDASKFEEVDTR